MASLYVRYYVQLSAQDSSTTTTHRVEVNQHALIDKILARYASAGAVYRELLQNSNDAEASQAEVLGSPKRSRPKKLLSRFTLMPNNNNDTMMRLKSRVEANQILASVSPKMGSGRVFIGFRTSQTTGLAAHLAAPLIPTVEREAIDARPTLKVYNTELLESSGKLMRRTLEHGMSLIGDEWIAHAQEREALEAKLLLQDDVVDGKEKEHQAVLETQESVEPESADGSSSLMSFAKFMARGVKKKVVYVMNTVENIVEIQDAVTARVLSDSTLSSWFMPLPVERWADFISAQPCMTTGQPEDEKLRTLVLLTLSKEYTSRSMTERVLFGSKLNGL